MQDNPTHKQEFIKKILFFSFSSFSIIFFFFFFSIFSFLFFFFFLFSYFILFYYTPFSFVLYAFMRNCMLEHPQYLLVLKNSVFEFLSFSLTQSVRPHFVPYNSLYSTSVNYGRPCHSIGHEVQSAQSLPRKSEDFPRGGKYPEDFLLPTQLDYLQLTGISWQDLFMCQGVLRSIISTSCQF